MDSMASIVAAKKMTSLKQRCKMKGIDPESDSPETERKVKERMEKDLRKREAEKAKRGEKYEEREKQREKLRSRVRDKYNIPDPANSSKGGTTEKSKKSEKHQKKDLREKDFYKYNKALPDERGKKLDTEPEQSVGHNFATMSKQLAEQTPEKSEKDCVIS